MSFDRIASYYTSVELAGMTKRTKEVALVFIQTMRAGWMSRCNLNSKTARQLGTNLRTLERAFPAKWYVRGTNGCEYAIELPGELQAGTGPL